MATLTVAGLPGLAWTKSGVVASAIRARVKMAARRFMTMLTLIGVAMCVALNIIPGMPQKIIRDPVHDVVAFQIERPLDALLFRLLNAAEFQRLRRILQLGMAHLAYPGATHSRYSHSLGVMQTARQILSHLGRTLPISEEDRTVCLVSALLHDLGHGP